MKKYAFTLVETLLVFVVIGVLAVLLISAVMGLQPDREKVMFKKAYSIAERTVGELVNDESIYPYDPERLGFYYDDDAIVEGTNTVYGGDSKFCMFFARKLNTFADAVFDATNNQCTFETTDGIHWTVPSKFVQPDKSAVAIMVDINSDKDPNYPNYTPDEVIADTSLLDKDLHPDLDEENRDRYYIFVEFDGRVRVASNSIEEEYLKSHDARKEKE